MSKRIRCTAMLLTLVLAVTMVFSAAPVRHTAEAASLSELQASQKNLKAQQAALDQKLAQLQNQTESQESYRDTLNEKISNLEQQISNLKNQMDAYDAQIAQKESEIADAETQINTDYVTLKKRLKMMYMMGESSFLDIIFSAENVADYFNRSEFVASIVRHDNSIIEKLKTETDAIREEKASIETDRQTLAAVKTEHDTQRKQLESAVAESERVSKRLAAQQQQAEQEKLALQAKYEQVDKAIEQWWIEYNRKQEELRRQQQASAITSTGTFMWPMPGYATRSNIGDRFGAGRGHRGVDINGAGIAGKAFVAADSGRVAYVSHNDSIYGIYCIIDHGNGYSTLYAHCSGLSVKVGQDVDKGQKIGTVGRSGIATGYHLHFGVLKNGIAIDPLQFFNIK